MGYLSPDHQWFLERGAPMTCGGTAWLIWRQVQDGQDVQRTGGGLPYLADNGNFVRTLSELTLGEATRPSGTRDLYAHVADAGSLAEAKQTASLIATPVAT